MRIVILAAALALGCAGDGDGLTDGGGEGSDATPATAADACMRLAEAVCDCLSGDEFCVGDVLTDCCVRAGACDNELTLDPPLEECEDQAAMGPCVDAWPDACFASMGAIRQGSGQ